MEIDISKSEPVNLGYTSNADFDLSVNVTKNGSDYDMTGKTVRMMVKKNRKYQSYLYRLVSGTEITISTNNLTWSTTMTLPNETYFYDVKNITDNDVIMTGLLKVQRDITE